MMYNSSEFWDLAISKLSLGAFEFNYWLLGLLKILLMDTMFCETANSEF